MFKAIVKEVKFDKGKFTQAMDKALKTQVKHAAEEWLREVANHVPVYTGMAKGSLLPLSRFLRVALSISPVANLPYGSPEKGSALGSFSFDTTPLETYSFSFSTEVPHYLINEFNVGIGSPPLRHPTPWNSMEAGRTAFITYMTEIGIDKLPKISDFIILTQIGSGVR